MIEKAFKDVVAAIRKLFGLFALLLVSPSAYALVNWWRGRKLEKTTNEPTEARKSYLLKLKERREERRRRRNDR